MKRHYFSFETNFSSKKQSRLKQSYSSSAGGEPGKRHMALMLNKKIHFNVGKKRLWGICGDRLYNKKLPNI